MTFSFAAKQTSAQTLFPKMVDSNHDERSPLTVSSAGDKESLHAARPSKTWLVVAGVFVSYWLARTYFQSNFAGVEAVSSGIRPHVIELARFSLLEGTDYRQFVSHAKALQKFFAGTQDAVRRSLIFNGETGVWSDIVYWTSMSAALQAADDIVKIPAAQPFLRAINYTTLQLDHAYMKVDWLSPTNGHMEQDEEATTLKVELAAFPLRSQVAKQKFIADAEATTPFFQDVRTAVHRVLAIGDDSITWYDIVYWTSLSAALDAARAIETVPAAQPFLRSIDNTSKHFQFTYSDLYLEQQFQYLLNSLSRQKRQAHTHMPLNCFINIGMSTK